MSGNIFRFNFLLFLFIISVFSVAPAQNTKRGFKLLEKSEYAKARDLFLESIGENKENPSALLGLTLILADDSSAYFNLIGAWEYACALKPLIEKFTSEEQEYIGEYFYNTEERHISRPVKKKIEYAVETVEAKLIKYVREENNLEIVYQVLKEFPDFRYYENVMHIRNQLEFRKYEKQNTLEGYLKFIKDFPEAAQVEKAIKCRNKLAFENACKINTVEAYKNYIKTYPEALEKNTAIKKLHSTAFQQAKQANNIQALDKFMIEYPEALEISEARIIQKQLLYEYAKKIQTLQAYNEFIRKYPEGQFYVDIFNLKSLDNGMRYLKTNPFPSNNIVWARSFEEEGINELNSCMAVDTNNAYVVGGTVFRTDTNSSDAWIIKLSPDGKMIWNKYVGEEYNDEIRILDVNHKNEIIGAGSTFIGVDSSSRETWVFKLGKDGQKIWSKKLGKMQVNCMTITQEDEIFLGGYLLNDSLESLYSIVVLNDDGKRLWGRTYSGKGEILNITEFPAKRMAIIGTKWRAKIDQKGYIIWESPFNETDSILAAQSLSRGEICYLGLRNKTKLVLIKTNWDNKILLEKELTLPEVKLNINSVIFGANNQLITLISFEEHQSINWINTINGEVISARLPSGSFITGITKDKNNNILMEACNNEILLIKNTGLAF